jgi:hypothetical protein
MFLTPQNSTNPRFWGMDLEVTNRGIFLWRPIEIPTEFDFFNQWCGKNPQIAKEYYR